MNDLKQLEDSLLEKVNGGENIDDPFTAGMMRALEGVFSLDKLFKQAGGNIMKMFSEILHEIYDKLDPVEQNNFLVVMRKMLLECTTTTDEEKQELEKELTRILSTIKK